MPAASDSRSVGELLRDLAGDSASLVRQEFALARTEAQDKLHQTITASTELVVGEMVALAALISTTTLRLGLVASDVNIAWRAPRR